MSAISRRSADVVNQNKTLGQLIRRDKYLLLMFLPVLIYYLVFSYLPMVGIVMGFEDFRMGSGFEGLFTSKWVGLKWFSQFFSSVFAWRLCEHRGAARWHSAAMQGGCSGLRWGHSHCIP